ncbi:hypothetical protein C1H46_037060 [Malus baccata]|uniref:Uncharacterized protein n=1 Tax=Malus baccata TaxID=106549 RepID=A0A540KTA8_MALBA|nr:hypothetical protein C1H46_037060 [Malus baccata]
MTKSQGFKHNQNITKVQRKEDRTYPSRKTEKSCWSSMKEMMNSGKVYVQCRAPCLEKERDEGAEREKRDGLIDSPGVLKRLGSLITITWDPQHHAVATKEQHNALASDIDSIIKNHCPLLWERSKFPEIDMFKEVYLRPGNELAKQLHSTRVEKGQTIMKEVASQLPPETSIEEVSPLEEAGFQTMTDTLD